MQTRRLFEHGRLETTDRSTSELAAILGDEDGDAWGWIDLTREDVDVLDRLAEKLDLHQLAVEDAFAEHERPKLMRYSTHMLLTVTGSTVGEDGEIAVSRLTAFLMPRLVITVRDDAFPMERVEERLESNADLAEHGVGFVLWGLLDVIVDDHIDTLDELDDEVEALTRDVFDDGADMLDVQRRAFRFRRSVARLRHTTLPLREVVTTLVRRDSQLVAPELQPYLSDVYDHTLHAADWTETLRDQVDSVLETNVALQGNRMNLIMKKVTSWAAIIAVPTAITGYFGQNVEFPFFSTAEGWWISTGLIVAASTALWFAFRRRDWL